MHRRYCAQNRLGLSPETLVHDFYPPAEAGGNLKAGCPYFELECGFSPFKPEFFLCLGALA
jgi:hypothetical protein